MQRLLFYSARTTVITRISSAVSGEWLIVAGGCEASDPGLVPGAPTALGVDVMMFQHGHKTVANSPPRPRNFTSRPERCRRVEACYKAAHVSLTAKPGNFSFAAHDLQYLTGCCARV